MTNELEKQFFDTFGIEPKSLFICKRGYYPEVCTQPTCKGCNEVIEHGKYPQITDRILLELICIWNDNCTYSKDWLIPSNTKKLKEATFYKFLTYKDCNVLSCQRKIYNQVRTLFEEG